MTAAAALATQRLSMRPFVSAHTDALHDLWTNPDVRRYLWDDVVIPRARAEELIAASSADFATRGYGFWSLFLESAPDALMGFCGFRAFEESGEPELLYGILPTHWGQGYTTEACSAALHQLFSDDSYDRVIAATDTPNQPSVKVMQRLGMVFEHRREYHGLDTVFYALGRADWLAHLERSGRH